LQVLRVLSARRWMVVSVLAALAGVAAVLLGRPSQGPPPTQTVILRRGNGAEPETLDPHGARSEAALTLLRDVYEGLTDIGPDGAPRLAAADQCLISQDGLTYRFHLRAAARWSNGEPVVAEDFASAWRRLVDPRTGAQYSQLLASVRGAEQIAAGLAAPSTLGSWRYWRIRRRFRLIARLSSSTDELLPSRASWCRTARSS